MNVQALKTEFQKRFGRRPQAVAYAPGRVNLIGEHTDYNDGFVLPIAIERRTLAAVAPRQDRIIMLASQQGDADARIDLDQAVKPGKPAWANYCRGVVAGLVNRGVHLAGAEVLFSSDIPLGGGLSSSAALEVATAMAVLSAAGRTGAVPPGELALICQKAEHEFAGAPCGIMDQSIAIMGRKGKAMLLDCRTHRARHVPFGGPEVTLLVADTQVKHEIGDGGYASRRQQCLAAAKKLKLRSLRDAGARTLSSVAAGRLTEKELMRVRHVIGEIARTRDAARALRAGDYERFGRLMVQSHQSLRDDYEVSCTELDAIVEAGIACKGVFGARMTGGGFGGCAIILARKSSSPAVTRAVQSAFKRRFGRVCPIFTTGAADGAGIIE